MSLACLKYHHHHNQWLIYLFLQQILGDKDFMFAQKPLKDLIKKLCTIAFMHKLCPKLIFFPDTYNATNLNMVSKSSCEIYFSE